MPAKITVAAYPNQPFEGEVFKIEPLAIVDQNVTMFAVLIRLQNRDGLLRPGMNADVEIQIASRADVASVPTAALRTNDDIPATAAMLGLEEAALRGMLYGEEAASGPEQPQVLEIAGRRIELPEGVDAERVQALIEKRRSGGTLSDEERALLQPLMRQLFAGEGRANGAGPPGGFPSGGFPGGLPGANDASPPETRPSVTQYLFGGEYWVIALRDGRPEPVKVRTGLTDLAHTEVLSGLRNGDEVLLLPSSSLFEQQARLQEFISARFSSTPFQQQQQGGGRFR
jgi:HlyD family secretion protein